MYAAVLSSVLQSDESTFIEHGLLSPTSALLADDCKLFSICVESIADFFFYTLPLLSIREYGAHRFNPCGPWKTMRAISRIAEKK